MIDKVRQAVMYILNKDNNGYLTPDEFNKYAELAQLEIFQEYFERYNDYSNKLKSGKINDGYADMLKQMDQTINYFSQNIVLSKSIDNATLVPTIIAGSISQVTITYPGGGYPPNTTGSVTISGSGIGASVTYTVDAVGNISSTTIVSGGTGYTSPVLTIDTSALSSSVYSLPDDWYLLNVLYYGQSEVMPVSQQDINYLLRSNLTAPTANYPSYVMHGNSVSIYPSAITGGVTLYYTRYPKIPNWTYVDAGGSEPVFNPTSPNYQDFEVADSEFHRLVIKILQYAGIEIREGDVVTYAASQEQIDQQSKKQ